jgi:hypothetical protein
MRTLCSGTLWIAMGALLCRCAPESAGGGGAGRLADDPSAIKGELVTYVADFEDGHAERWHALRLPGGKEMRLQFDAPPVAKSGVTLRVRGEARGPNLHVSDFEVVEADAAPPDPSPDLLATPAAETYAIVLVDLGSGAPGTAAQAQTAMFSATPTDKSFASYYAESSYGKYAVTGDVIGPYSFSMTTCDTTGMYQAIEPMITGTYNHLIYYFAKSSLCTFGGLGEEGSSAKPAKRTWMNGSIGCVVLMQEPGHNLGLMHANTMKCGTSTFSTAPATDCTITEYGSGLTTMGGGCKQLNAYERWYMNWLSGCNGVRVPGNGTYNLLPLETSCPGGTQVLQVPFPATLVVNDPQATTTNVNLKNYYLELRVAGGAFDAYSTSTRGGSSLSFTGPTVFLYTSDDVHIPTTTGRGSGGSSVWTELLNTTPSGTPFTGLTAAGQSFTDPAGGPTITLQSISATGATITVTNPLGTGAGTATCIDGSAFAEPGPASCGSTGAGGTTGAAGTSGAGGTTGAAGRGGTTGGAGTTGAGGRGGAAGASATGSAGTGIGAGGAAAGAGGTGDVPHETAVTGGCACRAGDGAGANPVGTGVAFVTLGLALGRRRSWRRGRSS